MLRWTIVFVLSAVSLINAVPTLAPEEPYKYIFYYGPTLLDNSITYDVSKGHQMLQHPNFEKSKPTVLYINGWQDYESVEAVVRAYLQRGDHNVIVLDWQQDNSGSYITEGLQTMKRAANAVGKSLVRMIDSGLSGDRLHLVGFSLGAHLAGYIGRVVNQESANGINLKRISGLDPSFAGFYLNQHQENTPINVNDADFVDIIHTDSWLNGAPIRTGTVDFWPNGGKSVQPGCPRRSSENYEESCSHTRAWVYWAESVANLNHLKRFHAVKANNWRLFQMGKALDTDADTVMGIDTPAGVSGDYYLQTNGELPFSRGRAGVEYSHGHSSSLVGSSPKPRENATFIYYYGPTFLDSQTYEIPDGPQILQHPKFDKSKKTVLYIHGYVESPEVESVHVIVDAYLQRGDHNIIIVDWHEDAAGNYFLSAVPKMKKLGTEVAKSLLQMFAAGLNVDQFHLVGHSLGVQMSGYIGRELKRKGTTLKRISGLDPAFPGFYPSVIGNTHISQSDADYVDIIHTDAWLYGAPTSTGTVDFWPNGGKTLQPGCPRRNFKPLSDNDLCSHRRSWWFWAESVANMHTQKFNAVKAKSWKDFRNGKASETDPNIVMGIDCPVGLSGDYYLQTNGETPFAKGPDGAAYVKESKK